MKVCCETCWHWDPERRRVCLIARFILEREDGAERPPLNDFFCCRYQVKEP